MNGDTGDPAMNSFNHYAYGSVGEWLYRFAAGIDTDPSAAGFKKIVIRPNVASGMTAVSASYDSLYGKIVSDWQAQPGKPFSLHVAIPPNTTATVYVPASSAESVSAKSAHFERMSGGYALYSIGSGDYQFEAAH
ncbi:MAG: alpha-L-rhamnosidase C-terminal domain-containing protein [Bryobacteraceae bacterium]